MRTWEKIVKQTAWERNRLHYTLHCKYGCVFPPSLIIKTAVRCQDAEKIIHKTQMALLNERIRQIYYRLDILEKQKVDAQEILFTHVANDTSTRSSYGSRMRDVWSGNGAVPDNRVSLLKYGIKR